MRYFMIVCAVVAMGFIGSANVKAQDGSALAMAMDAARTDPNRTLSFGGGYGLSDASMADPLTSAHAVAGAVGVSVNDRISVHVKGATHMSDGMSNAGGYGFSAGFTIGF